ncbi:MAG: cation transporter [Gallionellales bacterium 35-53-114]|jgi:cobalt-zinc-cadmium efflux system protein|nr:MAG: cation transporter [Gallionellales bacterium 35-53-114]OYZ63218.1 MAG: cation transporter [Gallionellales bacterium 24-53-125]OZB08684.1 MAG: cation transporter [Gallionellales bacterium 39-52-133]HQS57457.1 cation diffusion facilitator family transporter [Gallionellaceae bacterium]HQS74355.1 cation diffusion facilitator family transporter [Gallionellaceae bacterium]
MSNHTHHSHHHEHAAFDPTHRAFAVGVTLNLIFVAVELAFGFWANSLALLADAGHNFSDVVGLLIAWGALALAKRKPSVRFTYGLRSSTIMAALANAMLLLVAVGIIVWEGVHRLFAPEPVSGSVMIWVALLGVIINIGTALMLQRGSKTDINVRGAFLHMVADAAVSMGVVVAGLLMLWLGWLWLDGAVSILIALVILWSTWGLFRESINLSLQAVPAHVDAEALRGYLAGLPGVEEVHDLHIWAMSTTEIALTAHLLMPSGHPGDAFLHDVATQLEKNFHIDHPTLQIEIGSDAASCRLAPEDVV